MNDDAIQQDAEVTQPEFQPAWKTRAEAMERLAAQRQAETAGEFAEMDESGQVIAKPEPVQSDAALVAEKKAEQAATEQPKNELLQAQPEQTELKPAVAEQPAPKLRTIVVDGQRIEVDEAKIIEQGIRTLQKESAADKRLAEANRLLQRARSGYVEQEVQPVEEPAQSQPSYPDPRTLMETVGNLVRREIQATSAVDTFKAEFPEIASDPMLMRLAIDREDQRLQHALSVGDNTPPTADVFREHGKAIRDWLKQKAAPTSAPATPVVAAASADKLERKRTTMVVQSANARAMTLSQNQQPPTVQQQIEAIRLARKGRPVPSASRSF